MRKGVLRDVRRIGRDPFTDIHLEVTECAVW